MDERVWRLVAVEGRYAITRQETSERCEVLDASAFEIAEFGSLEAAIEFARGGTSPTTR